METGLVRNVPQRLHWSCTGTTLALYWHCFGAGRSKKEDQRSSLARANGKLMKLRQSVKVDVGSCQDGDGRGRRTKDLDPKKVNNTEIFCPVNVFDYHAPHYVFPLTWQSLLSWK